jgi:hypothetical protein
VTNFPTSIARLSSSAPSLLSTARKMKSSRFGTDKTCSSRCRSHGAPSPFGSKVRVTTILKRCSGRRGRLWRKLWNFWIYTFVATDGVDDRLRPNPCQCTFRPHCGNWKPVHRNECDSIIWDSSLVEQNHGNRCIFL